MRRLAGVQHDVGIEIEDLFEFPKSEVQQVPDLAGQASQKPDVSHRGGKLDVAHALTPHLGLDYLDAAFFAHHAAVLHPFVFAAVALIVLDRPEYPGAEKPVALRFESPVVYRFRFFHFAVGPFPDSLG